MRIRPECDAGTVWLMAFIFGEPKELRWLLVSGRIKSVESFSRASWRRRFVLFVNKSELGKKSGIELHCAFHVFHAQINVIEQSRSHYFDFRFSRRIINFNPDQVSSTAQTLISTKPSGSATARITSSVMSVGTPDDFFGQETQTAASSAIFCRRDCSCVCSPRRSLENRCTNLVLPTGRVAKFTPLGIWPRSLL